MNVTRLSVFNLSRRLMPPVKQYAVSNCLVRQISSVGVGQLKKNDSFVKKVIKKIPFLRISKSRLMASGYIIYEKIADQVNYVEFFDELDLPDTFYSWFVVTELHIWMLSARVMSIEESGRNLRNFMLQALWNDVNERIRHLGTDSNITIAREQVTALSEQLQASLIGYDEGLQGDDVVLAGALWRRFYQHKDVEVTHLNLLVRYVRKQMRLLDQVSDEDLLQKKKIQWISLK